MKQNTPRETSPRTAPPRFSTDDFDCELPSEARDELFTHKRPRILGRPVKNSHGLRRLGVAALVLLVATGAVIALWNWQRSLPHAAPVVPIVPTVILPTSVPTVAPAVQPAASPQPTPSSEPIQPQKAIEHVIEQPILPSRAQLLNLPTPRATVVRLPAPRTDIFAITPDHIDEAHDITMPYGTVVRATLRGFLEQENQLPQVGNIGDMYVVGSVPWIFIQVPGTTAPTWVDP